jgi:hypothetical protein
MLVALKPIGVNTLCLAQGNCYYIMLFQAWDNWIAEDTERTRVFY